jgi:hypothetical protein
MIKEQSNGWGAYQNQNITHTFLYNDMLLENN